MTSLKDILKLPIKETVILFCITLALFSIFLLVGTTLGRVVMRDVAIGIEDNHLLTFTRMIVWELVYISQLILKLTLVLLTAQTVYRIRK